MSQNLKQKELNEKLSYRTRCNKWKELKISGDITALCQITLRSQSIVSKAVNRGIGSLYVLRAVSRYFKDREDNDTGNVRYFANNKKNPIV